MRRSIARLSASVPSRHTQFSVDFTTNIAESNFRYPQAYRERQRLSVEQGLDAPHVPTAARGYDKYIGEMETALGTSPYLAGQAYSLADAAATPYIFRARSEEHT